MQPRHPRCSIDKIRECPNGGGIEYLEKKVYISRAASAERDDEEGALLRLPMYTRVYVRYVCLFVSVHDRNGQHRSGAVEDR